MNTSLLVFLGGGTGALLRWGISSIVVKFIHRPWSGTLVVNSLGCLLFFILVKFIGAEEKTLNHLIRVGFLGSLTTFSTFSYEIFSLLSKGKIFEALLVCALNLVFGVGIGFIILK